MERCGSCLLRLPAVMAVCLLCGQDLMERLDSLLCGDASESLKSLCLKLLLCLVTVRLNLWAASSLASLWLFTFLCQLLWMRLIIQAHPDHLGHPGSCPSVLVFLFSRSAGHAYGVKEAQLQDDARPW